MADTSLQFGGYTWNQSHDQVTVIVLCPDNVIDEEVQVEIDKDILIVSFRGEAPVVKGRLYASVTGSSMWQIEKPRNVRSTQRFSRARTTSTTSSTSSYAFLSDPDFAGSSFVPSDAEDNAHRSGVEFGPSPALSSSPAQEGSPPLPVSASTGTYRARTRGLPLPSESYPNSPRASLSLVTSASSMSLASAIAPARSRLLTIHLQKTETAMWPNLITGPAPVTDESFVEAEYNMDPFSLSKVGDDLLKMHEDPECAFEYLARAWRQGRIPMATLKLESHYIPLQADISSDTVVSAYVTRLGGPRAVAQLFLDTGLLHLQGVAPALLASSPSSEALSSLRHQHHNHDNGPDNIDHDLARRYFDKAKLLDPTIIVPDALGELRMPSPDLSIPPPASETGSRFSSSIPSASEKEDVVQIEPKRRRRRDAQPIVEPFAEPEETWTSLYVPAILGAGTALLAVSIVGIASMSWWRKNQS